MFNNMIRKKALLRCLIFGIISAILLTTVCVAIGRNSESDTSAASGTTNIYWDDEGWAYYPSQLSEDDYTHLFYVEIGGNWEYAYCVQPTNLDMPSVGPRSYSDVSMDSTVMQKMKLLLFITKYSNSISVARQARNAVFEVGNDFNDQSALYGWTHILAGYLNGDVEAGNVGWGWFDRASSKLGEYINGSDVWTLAQKTTLYRTTDHGGSQELMWLGAYDFPLGAINVQKCDEATQSCTTTTGGASLQGIHFKVYNNSGSRIYRSSNDTFYDNGAMIAEGDTDANGRINFASLPADGVNYRVVETATNSSYELTAAEQTVTLSSNGQTENLSFYNVPYMYGEINVQKCDQVSHSCTNTTGGASLQGIKFEVRNDSGRTIINRKTNTSYANGAVVASGTTDANGHVGFSDLPADNVKYKIVETETNNSYMLTAGEQTVTLSSNGQTENLSFYNIPYMYGEINVQKCDQVAQSCTTTIGDASLQGIKFELRNDSGHRIYNAKTNTYYDNGAIIATGTTDANGHIKFSNLPANDAKYKITETETNNSYMLTAGPQTVTLSTHGQSETLSFYDIPYMYGEINVQKCDIETNSCSVPQGNASFQGIEFKVYNNSGRRIYNAKANVYYDNGAVVATGTTDANGHIKFENLPANEANYRVVETATNASYELTAGEQTVSLTMHGQSETRSFKDRVRKGKVTVNKIDAETRQCNVRARAHSFAGTTFQIINKSNNPVYYNGGTVLKDGVVDTKVFGENQCSFTVENLPYGKYWIKETVAAPGYVKNNDPIEIVIPTNNSYNLSTTVENQQIRGDLRFIKMDTNNNRPMSNTLFSISAVDEDFNILETHFVVSNSEGVVDTSSAFALHSFHTNGYDAMVDDIDTAYTTVPFLGYGSWFGFDTQGHSLPVNDSLGALPQGKYLIQEMRCDANIFCYNLKDEKIVITISQAGKTVNLGTWDNDCAIFELETEAVDGDDGDHYVEADKDVKIVDHVHYCARTNKEFTIKGVLMNRETGEPLLINGEKVESSVKVTPKEECEDVDMEFVFDGSGYGGEQIVVFESLYYGETELTSHEDLDDDYQTVEMVHIQTFAANNETMDKTLPLDQDVTIRDIVDYCLKPGVEYRITGVLMDKETAAPYLVDGKPVEGEVIITPEERCGQVDMFFQINTTDLGGKEFVVFESLYIEDELIVEHKDFNNEDETVRVEVPAPNTGALTNSKESGSSASGIFVAVFGVVAVSFGGYMGARYFARRKVMKF